MAYRGLTAIGANYLATRLAQELPVEITRVQIGAGTPIGNPGDVSELQNYKLDAKILKKSQENNTLEITIQVVNEDVDQGFYLKEIGVFVNDDTEKLYWYCNEDNAQYIPAKTDSAIAFEIDIKMEVTNIESPIMNWSGKGTWIDKDYLEEVLKNHVVNNLTEQSATKALAANQGVVLDNKDVGIMGGRDGKFPLTAATKGNIYLLESTQKYYICINDYDGIQISVPNANFEELSVYTNRSKLDNLDNGVFQYYYQEIFVGREIEIIDGFKYLDIAAYPTSRWEREDTVVRINLDVLKYDKRMYIPIPLYLAGGIYQVERVRYIESTSQLYLYKWSTSDKPSFFLAYTYFHN